MSQARRPNSSGMLKATAAPQYTSIGPSYDKNHGILDAVPKQLELSTPAATGASLWPPSSHTPLDSRTPLTCIEDISSERYREYRFLGGDVVRIEAPLKLNVSESGGHRIFDAEGVSHYVPAGWIHLSWVAKDGEPNFVK